MYCKKCGKEIPDDSIYCNHCGTRQTPKKILVEFTEPSLPSLNGDSIRNGIFRIGRFLKKLIVSLKPLVIVLLISGIIATAAYYIAYYSYYCYHLPQEASDSEVKLYEEKGVSSREGYYIIAGAKQPVTFCDYKNPSEILPNCKWEFDDELINRTDYRRWFRNNINETRKSYLEYKSESVAFYYPYIAFGVCMFVYFVVLLLKFRNWFYKK